MSRVKTSVTTRKRRKKVLKQAKGYWGRRSKLYKTAKEKVRIMTASRRVCYTGKDRKSRPGQG